MRRIIEIMTNFIDGKPIFHGGKPTNPTKTTELYTHIDKQDTELGLNQLLINELKNDIDTLNKTITQLRQTNYEYLNTITQLGQKDTQRIKALEQLQKDNSILIQTNERITSKIITMRTDMEHQATFMASVNTAIQTMLAGLTKLPDNMPSLAPNFHDDTPTTNPLSTEENPPYHDATQEILQTIINPQTPEPHTPAKPFYNDPPTAQDTIKELFPTYQPKPQQAITDDEHYTQERNKTKEPEPMSWRDSDIELN